LPVTSPGLYSESSKYCAEKYRSLQPLCGLGDSSRAELGRQKGRSSNGTQDRVPANSQVIPAPDGVRVANSVKRRRTFRSTLKSENTAVPYGIPYSAVLPVLLRQNQCKGLAGRVCCELKFRGEPHLRLVGGGPFVSRPARSKTLQAGVCNGCRPERQTWS
jgi:hypothetical protein